MRNTRQKILIFAMRILEGFRWTTLINDAECLAEFRFRKHDVNSTSCRSPSNTRQLYVRVLPKYHIKFNESALYSSEKIVLHLQIQ